MEEAVAYSRYYAGICLEELTKITTTPIEDARIMSLPTSQARYRHTHLLRI
jgi:hypothetical protein